MENKIKAVTVLIIFLILSSAFWVYSNAYALALVGTTDNPWLQLLFGLFPFVLILIGIIASYRMWKGE